MYPVGDKEERASVSRGFFNSLGPWPACAAALLCGLLACSESGRTLAIATGGPSGLYYPFGGGLAQIWSREIEGVNVKAEVTGGSVTNVIQVARGESDIGMAMADVVSAAHAGTGKFPRALPLRVLFTAYPNVVHILTLAENGIDSISAMRGKRISLGAQGSGTAVAAANVLEGLGLGLENIAPRYLSFGETTSALKDGTIDAGFVVGGLGLAAVTELAVTRNLLLVALSETELDQLVEQFPAYAGFRIPAGTYGGLDVPVQTLGIWSALVVHEDMPKALAFRLACEAYGHRDRLLKISPVASAMTVATAHEVPAVPLHPGSLRFLQDPAQPCFMDQGAL
ncbi:MAG TPA: TRAP transporter substrate-binding protein [Gammaproteobacteria bacterium]|nr:TRAP transporter substrate-binding protein [Gammaproteobacteria bacterium]HBK18052.1 TRAP transporter substrate-binding protein [Gammaproteobacteria bacterium]